MFLTDTKARVTANHNQSVIRRPAGVGLTVNHNQTIVRTPLVWPQHNQTLILGALSTNHNQTIVRAPWGTTYQHNQTLVRR